MPISPHKHENACDYPTCANDASAACDFCFVQYCEDRHGDTVKPGEDGNKCYACGGYNADAPQEAFEALLVRFSAQRQLGPFATIADADSARLREAA